MFLVDWFYGILASLGLWQKEANILLLGLPNAGKTTLLHKLAYGISVEHQPTQYLTSEEFRIGRISFKAFDVGGTQLPRLQVLEDYGYLEVSFFDAVVYVVDANDRMSFRPSRDMLECLFFSKCFANVILGNKIDLPHAASEFELRRELLPHPPPVPHPYPSTSGNGIDLPRAASEFELPYELRLPYVPRWAIAKGWDGSVSTSNGEVNRVRQTGLVVAVHYDDGSPDGVFPMQCINIKHIFVIFKKATETIVKFNVDDT